MVIKSQAIIIAFIIFCIVWFLYIERAIFPPFIVAGIFAYICNPVVNFLTHKIKLRRSMSILVIYALLMGLVVGLSIILTGRVIEESSQLQVYLDKLLINAKKEVLLLPDFFQPAVQEVIDGLENFTFVNPVALVSFFPQAISRIISFLIFLFSSFYLLKDGKHVFNKLLVIVSPKYKSEVEIALKKIDNVLRDYLRGQLFLVGVVSIMLFVALVIFGLRFSLIIAIFSGFAEIVPVLGPIVACLAAVLVFLLTGTNNFYLDPLIGSLVITIIYFVIRHFQDYFITPHVMGRITKLHPFIIFFAVIAGGHIGGMLGLILAVPCAAMIKIFFEFLLSYMRIVKESPGRE